MFLHDPGDKPKVDLITNINFQVFQKQTEQQKKLPTLFCRLPAGQIAFYGSAKSPRRMRNLR